MYEEGRGVAKDKVEAVKWYRKAAEQGEADGQYRLGEMYDKGLGVESNANEAVKWFRKAADNGNEKAKTIVAQIDLKVAERNKLLAKLNTLA